MGQELQLAQIVDSHDYAQVIEEVIRIHGYHYHSNGAVAVRLTYEQVRSLFEGDFPGYRACLSGYHDFRHTMDIVLASARLLDGYNLRWSPLSEPLALELLLAAFLHDTGYIQEEWDTEGTGAKYSREHEERSVAFLERHAGPFHLDKRQVGVITRFIQSTDLKRDFTRIPFASQEEREAGALLGTADLLGQMADREYLEKLLFLYFEFREAGVPGYDTEFDILRKTRDFYSVIRQRLEASYLNVQELARLHFAARHGTDRNLYAQAIDRQMAYLDKIIQDDTSNFRAKLKRGDQRALQGYSHKRLG